MAETIESFVARLQQDGVESGRRQAEELVAAARGAAQGVLDEARREAERIVAEARREAAAEHARTEAELRLAARDVALKLQRALTEALRAALARGAERTLADPDFLAQVLRELVLTYARADAAHKLEIEINLPSDMVGKLADWAMREIREVRSESGAEIDIASRLQRAGFEYKIQGATVDVTVESVVERLMELVGPTVRELFAERPAKGTL
jgi:hypothetical protein